MVHIGSAPPELPDILSLLESGDIMTHCFNGKTNGILDQETKTIKQIAVEAKIEESSSISDTDG